MNGQNILALQTAFLGDVILSTPLIRGLNRIFPDAAIDILTTPETRIVFEHNPYIREILVFDKKRSFKKFASFTQLVMEIRKRNYDLGISIQSSVTSALLLYLSGIPQRLGFSRQKFLTLTVPHTPGLHKIQKILRLLEPLSSLTMDIQTELYWTEREEQKSVNISSSLALAREPLIGMAPGSIWFTKRWPREYFIKLCEMLIQKGNRIVLIGGNDDQTLCEAIANRTGAISVAGTLSVLESAALIQKLDLLITNDSAPLHIANAVQTDLIAIFGPTVKELGFYPFRAHDRIMEVDLPCRPCGTHGGKTCPRGHHQCMKLIGPEMVFNAVMNYFKILPLQKKEGYDKSPL